MPLLPDLSLRAPLAAVFVPAERFFVRVMPLVAGEPVEAQVRLALDALAPFPPAQLYWGCWVAPGGESAVVYAAHRRRFTPEETAGWAEADLVVPDLLPLLGTSPGGAAVALWAAGTRVVGVAWAAGPGGPAAVLARDAGPAAGEDFRLQLAADLAARAGLVEPPVLAWSGGPTARAEGREWIFSLPGHAGQVRTAVPAAGADLLDIRDRDFLAERRRGRRRSGWAWRIVAGSLAAAVAALALEGATLALGRYAWAQQAGLAARAPLIARLETMHGLASRLEDLAGRRLRFFEMLDAVNRPRPASILFTRVATTGPAGLEIEAQTREAAEIGAYEAGLRQVPGLVRAETRDLRTRDGVTTFGLVVGFRPAAVQGVRP